MVKVIGSGNCHRPTNVLIIYLSSWSWSVCYSIIDGLLTRSFVLSLIRFVPLVAMSVDEPKIPNFTHLCSWCTCMIGIPQLSGRNWLMSTHHAVWWRVSQLQRKFLTWIRWIQRLWCLYWSGDGFEVQTWEHQCHCQCGGYNLGSHNGFGCFVWR